MIYQLQAAIRNMQVIIVASSVETTHAQKEKFPKKRRFEDWLSSLHAHKCKKLKYT